MTRQRLFGVAAEFEDPVSLVEVVRHLHERGFRQMEAYTPYPLHELDEYIRGKRRLPFFVLIGGLFGALTAWVMQFYIAIFAFPTNVGGRPLNSWPSFIPIMFELTILFAAATAFVGTLVLCGFPRPHHPMFGVPGFEEASNNRFFVCVEFRDPLFSREAVAELFQEVAPVEVRDVYED